MKRISRILSLILCLALCASLGVTAFAEEESPENYILTLARSGLTASEFINSANDQIEATAIGITETEREAYKLSVVESGAALLKANNLPHYAVMLYYVGIIPTSMKLLYGGSISVQEENLCGEFVADLDKYAQEMLNWGGQHLVEALYSAAVTIYQKLYHDVTAGYDCSVRAFALLSQLEEQGDDLLFGLAQEGLDEMTFRGLATHILTLAADELDFSGAEEAEKWKSQAITAAAQRCRENGLDDYARLLNGMNGTASILSEGNLAIVIIVAVLAVGGVAALVIVKKKKTAEE